MVEIWSGLIFVSKIAGVYCEFCCDALGSSDRTDIYSIMTFLQDCEINDEVRVNGAKALGVQRSKMSPEHRNKTHSNARYLRYKIKPDQISTIRY